MKNAPSGNRQQNRHIIERILAQKQKRKKGDSSEEQEKGKM
jgi:hypothetical protein